MRTAGAYAGRGRRIVFGGIAAAVLLLPAILLAQVDTAWVRRYDGPAHGSDWATCIAVDSAGNVYVAGASSGVGTGGDFVVIKYGPSGDSLWAAREDFSGHDSPEGLAIDAGGNVYVAGTTDNGAAIAKYDSAGRRQWTKLLGSRSSIRGLVLDSQGNAIVAGSDSADGHTSYDAMVIKYRSGGDTAWARLWDWSGHGDRAWMVDLMPLDGVLAAGTCNDADPGGNMLSLVHDSVGHLEWATVFDGPRHGDDRATSAAACPYGGWAVTGLSDSGYGTPPDYLTIKYSPAGETLWTRRYNGTANDWDEARAVFVDSLGNVYVTGYADFTDTGHDFATFKYRPDGSVAWLARYDSPTHSGDGAYDIVVGSDGRVYVTGNSYTPITKGDCATVCYDSLGDTVWVRRYNTPNNQWEYTSAIALAPAGAVCVAGRGGSATTGDDILVIKYAPRGAVAEQEAALPPGAARLTVIPSPCHSRASVRWRVQDAGPARIAILDALGRPVRVLLDGSTPAGGEILWDRTDAAGERLPAGVYFVELDTGGRSQRAKLLVID